MTRDANNENLFSFNERSLKVNQTKVTNKLPRGFFKGDEILKDDPRGGGGEGVVGRS